MSAPILDRPNEAVVELTLDHAGMSVADLDRSTSFYVDVFSFAVEERFAIPNTEVRGAVLIHPGGARIELSIGPARVHGQTETRSKARATRVGSRQPSASPTCPTSSGGSWRPEQQQ